MQSRCWFDGSSFKDFSIVFLFSNWLELNHLKSRMECGFSDIFSCHVCSTRAETIDMTIYAASFRAKKCSENHILSCWDDARTLEPTNIQFFRSWKSKLIWGIKFCILCLPTIQNNYFRIIACEASWTHKVSQLKFFYFIIFLHKLPSIDLFHL